MKRESDGRQLKRELSAEIRSVLDPLVPVVRARVLALPSRRNTGMRQAIARQTRVSAKFSGRDVGAVLIQRARGMPRGFQYAGRAFNDGDSGWHPKSIDGSERVQHTTPAGWFDQPVERVEPDARERIQAAIAHMAERIAARARRG